MKKRIILASSILLGLGMLLVPPTDARHTRGEKYNVASREDFLEKKINEAYSANQLTLKESDDLKGKLKKIRDTEQKMKDKNGGKLSYSDNTNLEKSLNGVSEKLHKKMLEKRVQ